MHYLLLELLNFLKESGYDGLYINSHKEFSVSDKYLILYGQLKHNHIAICPKNESWVCKVYTRGDYPKLAEMIKSEREYLNLKP